MDFLERFAERDRERLLEASTPVRLARGEYLLKRGEKGGDVYRVAEGELEIIDNRSQPAVVLDVIGKGAMVGEMAFLEDQVRTADVRAAENSVVHRWDRRALMRILDADPTFAAGFYRGLAGLAVDRARAITTNAMVGAIGGGRGPAPGNEAAVAQGRRLAAGVRGRLLEIEPVIRRDRALAHRELLSALHSFSEAAQQAFARLSEEDLAAAGAEIARELHPYVMRSQLGELAIDRPDGHCGSIATLAHLLHGQPMGDGPLGEMFDEWLLTLPTSRAFRERTAVLEALLGECLPAVPPFRILALSASSVGCLPRQLEHLGRLGGEIICIDQTREIQSVVDAQLHARPRNVRIKHVVDDLGRLVLGRARIAYAPQHVVIVDGVVEYLPERVAVSLMRYAHDLLAPGGHVLVTSMVPAPDDALYRFLLNWPMVRRSRSAIQELLEGADLVDARTYEAGSAGVAAIATRR